VVNLQNNSNKKSGAFAQLQAAFEQVKAEVVSQINGEFGEILPDFAKFSQKQPNPTQQQQSHSLEQQPRSVEQRPVAVSRPVRTQQKVAPPNPKPSEMHSGCALVSNLNATSARDAIILSEIIGKPLAKRQTVR